MTHDDLPLLDSPPRKANGTIDHTGCPHLATPAGRKECRDHVARNAPPAVGDSVMVWLDDAPSEMPATVTAISESGIRYTVKMTRSGNYYGVWLNRVRKP